MKYARVIDNTAYDVLSEEPTKLFTSEIAEQFVKVPDHVENFWSYDGAVWSAPTTAPLIADPHLTLHHAKEARSYAIDRETSAAILSGFNFSIDGTLYHFNYDSFDQQNFTDTATIAQLALSGTDSSIPASVIWNGYTIPDGKLVRFTMNPIQFLSLYTEGALTHKATQMEAGGLRKAAVSTATTIAEVDSF